MKHLFMLVIVCSFSTAFATKARQKALANSFHLSAGTQTVYTSPYHLMSLDNFVALEAGLTTSTSVDNGAEGSILMNVNSDAKLFLSVGHLDESVQSQRKFVNGIVGVTGYKAQQNPAEIIYSWKDGSTVWGFGTYYSNFNNKAAKEKESSAGLRLAASYGDFKWKANLGLVNKAVNTAGDELNGDTYFNLGLRYNQNTLRYGLDVTTWAVSQTLNAGVSSNLSHSYQDINLRVVDVRKTEAGEFFMGAGLQQVTVKDKLADKKFNRTTLPLVLGAETKANDWLVLRGSVTQSVLISQSKNEVGYTSASLTGANGVVDAEFSAEANNTAVAAGVGIMMNKVQFDATLTGLTGSAATQNINGTDFLAQVGAVYKY
jgi:hypothetical protein